MQYCDNIRDGSLGIGVTALENTYDLYLKAYSER